MEFKYIGILGLIVFCCYLAKVHKPSLYGWIMTLLCVYIPVSGKFPFDLGPGINLINVFFVVLFFVGKCSQCRQETYDPVQKMGILWICVLFFAFIMSIFQVGFDNVGNLLVSLKRLLDPFIVYFFSKRLVQENDQRAVLDGIILGVIFFSWHLFLQGLDIGDKVRVGGFFDQANAAAAFIAAYAPLLLSSLNASKKLISSLIFIVSLVICGIAAVQTVSRGGIIALGLGLLLAASLSQKKIIKVTVWGLTLAIIVSPALLPEKLMSRFEGKNMSGNENDMEAKISMSARSEVWKASFPMILSNPIGVGLDGFQREIVNYGGPRMDAHNIYLRVWGEMGTQGLLVFLGLIFHLFKRGWQGSRARENGFENLVGTALVGCILALCITNMTSTTMLNSLVVSYIGVLAAVSYQISTIQLKSPWPSGLARS